MESRGCSVLELGALAAGGQRRLHVSCHSKRGGGAARGGSRHGLFIRKGKTAEQGNGHREVHGGSMPAWAEDGGGLDSGGEKGQTPICVSVVWKSRSQLRRRRGDEASWVVGAASSLQSARLLKSRRATRYLAPPPDAPTEGCEGHEGGMEVEGGRVGVCKVVQKCWSLLQGEASCCGAWPASQFGPHTVAESGHGMEKDPKKKKGR